MSFCQYGKPNHKKFESCLKSSDFSLISSSTLLHRHVQVSSQVSFLPAFRWFTTDSPNLFQNLVKNCYTTIIKTFYNIVIKTFFNIVIKTAFNIVTKIVCKHLDQTIPHINDRNSTSDFCFFLEDLIGQSSSQVLNQLLTSCTIQWSREPSFPLLFSFIVFFFFCRFMVHCNWRQILCVFCRIGKINPSTNFLCERVICSIR